MTEYKTILIEKRGAVTLVVQQHFGVANVA